MKKRFLIILAMVFWCNVGFANGLTQQGVIDKHLSNRKLEPIEGFWNIKLGSHGGTRPVAIHKEGGRMRMRIAGSCPGDYTYLTKTSDTFYTSTKYHFNEKCKKTKKQLTVNIILNPNNKNLGTAEFLDPGNISAGITNYSMERTWPSDFDAHNAKFKTKEDIAEDDRALAAMVNEAKKTCKVLGFEDGSEKMADCTLKLYSQKVDELVAKKVANMQSQTTTTTQSSGTGSNTVTIYDPVRDSQRLKDQGMGMIMGRCKFGYNC